MEHAASSQAAACQSPRPARSCPVSHLHQVENAAFSFFEARRYRVAICLVTALPSVIESPPGAPGPLEKRGPSRHPQMRFSLRFEDISDESTRPLYRIAPFV
jgi:hypothetical protein